MLYMDMHVMLDVIRKDIIENESEIFNRYDYYTHKYRGDLLNDVNVGLFLNDNLDPTVQIYLSNKYRTIRYWIIFSKDGRTIKDEVMLNDIDNTEKNMGKIKILEFEHKLYDAEKTIDEVIIDAKSEIIANTIETINNAITVVKHYPENGFMKVELFINEDE